MHHVYQYVVDHTMLMSVYNSLLSSTGISIFHLTCGKMINMVNVFSNYQPSHGEIMENVFNKVYDNDI